MKKFKALGGQTTWPRSQKYLDPKNLAPEFQRLTTNTILPEKGETYVSPNDKTDTEDFP